jgi:hypothetical protein
MNYWKSANLLLETITENNMCYDINPIIKSEILLKIKMLSVNDNVLVSRLLIYNKINDNNLLNFLFYISINNERLYNLFLKDACKFAKTFMFAIHDVNLPNIHNVFTEIEINLLKSDIEINQIISNIYNLDAVQLKNKFPKCYYFTLINPKALEY